MHVLQLCPYPPPEGGISRNSLAIREQLQKNEHKCSIIATARSSVILPEPDVYHPGGPLALIRLLLKLDYDVLHLHVGGRISRRILALIFVCGLFRKGKSVLSVHSGGFPTSKEGLAATRLSLGGLIFRRYARIIAVNPLIAAVFEKFGVAKNTVRVIYPFVHKLPDKTIVLPAHLREFAERHKPFLLTVGLLEEDYDLFMQIDAMEAILRDCPNAGLMIIGSGSLEEKLREAIAGKDYANNILLAGDVEHKFTLHLINDCDILLRTTVFDGDAISVREALFLKTPVIATDNGMRPDGVHLIPVHDIEKLTKAIKEMAKNGKPVGHTQNEDIENIRDVIDLYKELYDS